MLLEDAGVLSKRRRLVFPIVDLPDDDLERVLRRCGNRAQRERHDEAERARNIHDPVHAHPPVMLIESTVRRSTGCIQ